MQNCYEAILDHGEIKWLGDAPSCQNEQMIVVTGDDDELDEFYKTVAELKLPDGVTVFSLLRSMSPEQLMNLAKNNNVSTNWQNLIQVDNDNGITDP